MDIDRFFDEHVCYNLTLQERQHIGSQEACLAFELSQVMPLTGALLAACGNASWCKQSSSPMGTAWTPLYAQAVRDGNGTWAGRPVQRWMAHSPLGDATFLVDPHTRVLYRASVSGGQPAAVEFHNLTTPAPAAATTPSFAGACVNMSSADPFTETVALASYLTFTAPARPPAEWELRVDEPRLIGAINAQAGHRIAWHCIA